MSTFTLPDLGEGLAEAEIVEWHVQPGDRVVVDQPMVSLETAKAVVEVPVPYSGIVTALHGAVGDIVATGAPLIDFDSGTVVGSMPAPSEEEFTEPVVAQRGAAGDRGGERTSRARALPVARAVAQRLGIALGDLVGSGPAGVVQLDDVLRHSQAVALPASARPAPHASVSEGATVQPLRGARRAMARSMSLSRDQISGSTVCDDADLQAWAAPGDYMPRLVRAMVRACAAEPALNAWYDAVSDSRRLFTHVDLALAVDTADGLIVPVLRNVQDQSLDRVRAQIRAHKEAARERSSTPEDLRDCTLMLSNFGTLAGRYGIPLVVPPAVAILGAGKARKEAVVVGDTVMAHLRMPLSLSFDHRCVTGGEACRFLAAVIADLERAD